MAGGKIQYLRTLTIPVSHTRRHRMTKQEILHYFAHPITRAVGTEYCAPCAAGAIANQVLRMRDDVRSSRRPIRDAPATAAFAIMRESASLPEISGIAMQTLYDLRNLAQRPPTTYNRPIPTTAKTLRKANQTQSKSPTPLCLSDNPNQYPHASNRTAF